MAKLHFVVPRNSIAQSLMHARCISECITVTEKSTAHPHPTPVWTIRFELPYTLDAIIAEKPTHFMLLTNRQDNIPTSVALT